MNLGHHVNINSQKETKKVSHGVGISRKSIMGFEGLWAHRPSKHTTDFLGMPIPMRDFLCLLLRLVVKNLTYMDCSRTIWGRWNPSSIIYRASSTCLARLDHIIIWSGFTNLKISVVICLNSSIIWLVILEIFECFKFASLTCGYRIHKILACLVWAKSSKGYRLTLFRSLRIVKFM